MVDKTKTKSAVSTWTIITRSTDASKHGLAQKDGVCFLNYALDQPLRWKTPRRIFVCAHGDLFHENVPDAWIDKVFAVMALCPRHTFQILTKRADRMRAYMKSFLDGGDERWAAALTPHQGSRGAFDLGDALSWLLRGGPLRNVWLGVSVEDQAQANERIPDLLATPAAVRWLSCEPLLGPVDLEVAWHGESALDSECWGECNWCRKGDDYPPLWNCQRHQQTAFESKRMRSGLDWVVAGGESGPGARPMHPDWARSLRDQCAAADVPFLFTQWGEWWPLDQAEREWDLDRQTCREMFLCKTTDDHAKIGKTKAGRLLDGVQYDGYPEARP